ncbi:FAS1-like dehydratase domain-containing protein [Pseudonocardia sp. GCM10023141]|uniref:FAS1-like dehydratase domain-containing protein n=1 Tax=Pseudonocardia sp. GCM10023141 TaxID=3252653 RepID=UPI0036078EE8
MDPVTFPVEPGHVMLFARAVYDDNPVYRDPAYAQGTEVGGIIAPPTFTQVWQQYVPDYAWRPAVGQPWVGSGSEPSGRPAEPGVTTVLHAEQHYEYHRHVRPGDVLTMIVRDGARWEKQGRNGLLRFAEFVTEFRDGSGALVVTCRTVEVAMPPVEERDDGG